MVSRCAPLTYEYFRARRGGTAPTVRDVIARHRREARLQASIFGGSGPEVIAGPFAGMRYSRYSTGSAYWPKVLGTYEAAVQPHMERLINSGPKRVVDIGCAEGYYAVGLALRLPHCEVVASDIDAVARALCRRLARRNGVHARVHITAALDHSRLDALCGEGTVLIVDAEGAELELLQPLLVPSLAQTAMLVELHDFIDSSISACLRNRFESTHTWETIDEVPPPVTRVQPRLSALSDPVREHVVSEYRPEKMQWAFASPTAVAAEAV